MAAAGEHEDGARLLAGLTLPAPVQDIVDRLIAVASRVAAEEPSLAVTIDPVENRGFEYYTGLGFSLFSRGVRGELGRGGRYQVDGLDSEGSCGLTLYMETVIRAIAEPSSRKRLFLPSGTPRSVAADLRDQGWITIAGLDPATTADADARRLGCTHVLRDNAPVSLETDTPSQQS